ncbi:PRD domain-containing protein [Halalkalibacterium ligniniphilum]|uniref:PRD domain-containing protein n=1 Tax=Halalkalibacterium ligniniphilum TaxID=1134413 RepID=UPI0003483260|nr:PRD domain-containing protein [Halalkalibacterium ligniniphilum]
MKVNKILNNNVVVVKEGQEEIIVMGPGIGFGKSKNDVINSEKIEKVFVMKDEHEYEKFAEIIRTLPEEHINLAESIISYAEKELGTKLNEHIHVALTDHLSFAIERIQKGYKIHNKLLNEIRALYPKEYEIGRWAQKLIEEKLHISFPDDEVGHIALHLHTAKMNHLTMHETMNTTMLINELITKIEERLGVRVEEESISYQRLITHLNFALKRAHSGESFHDIDQEMLMMIQAKHSIAYKLAKELADFLKASHQLFLPESEIAYLTLHIQRIERATKQ